MVRWFFETEVPSRYAKFLPEIPRNAILSTTIETNRTYRLYEGPVQPDPVEKRLEAMQDVIGRGWQNVHISIEPIVDFDPDTMQNWMGDIHGRVRLMEGKQLMVSMGYDNYSTGLPVQKLAKTEVLIKTMENSGIFVERKVLREKMPQQGEW